MARTLRMTTRELLHRYGDGKRRFAGTTFILPIDLTGADLRGADFSGAMVKESDFTDAETGEAVGLITEAVLVRAAGAALGPL